MADLQELQRFADEHKFGLTNPLTHEQVLRLAEYWFPEMRFYEEEKFHPISLDEAFSMVEDTFGSLPATAQEEWRVNEFVREGANIAARRAFDPPVVHVPDGVVMTGQTFQTVVRVLNDRSSAREALSDAAVDSDTVITHGASFRRSNQFFGPLTTLSGTPEAAAGDPFLPRATGDDGSPQITVMASFLNLLELLKYELLVSADEDYPPDGMRGTFDIARTLVRPAANPSLPLPFPTLRQFLLEMIASLESAGAIPPPPVGWRLDRVAWDTVTRYAFLEYDFFYAYNDFELYQPDALFANQHEGDIEGCCLVFDRNVLNVAAIVNDPNALFRAVPHSIITSVHEEFQDADDFKFIPTPISFPADTRARDIVPFTVYVAAGSHATYLTGGTHDLVDFQDYTSFIEENPAALLLGPFLVDLLIILAIIEHFTDTEDVTSDDGVRTGPEEVVGPQPTAVASRLIVLPMSADNHIYGPGNDELLRLRAFAGKWGGHAGVVDKSPQFRSKTGRYFRKLLSQI